MRPEGRRDRAEPTNPSLEDAPTDILRVVVGLD